MMALRGVTRRNMAALILAGLAVLVFGPVLLEHLMQAYQLLPLEWRKMVWVFRHKALPPYLSMPLRIYSNPWTYGAVIGVFLLERVIPARREQRVLSAELAQDFLWFNLDCIFRIVWVSLYLELLRAFYDKNLSFLTIDAVAAWSPAARWVWSFVIFDFLNWFHHVIRHRVEVLWYFHMVHHSQRNLNLFTDARVHLVEYFVTRTIMFLPLFILQVDRSGALALAIVLDWYTRVYHANIRTNYGPFKYILVTPQSHRIHHSRDPAHYNTNFGLFLTVWDRLFGTLHSNYNEYPETGIEEAFPLEDMVVGLNVFAMYGRQMLYPFRLIARRIAKAASVSGGSLS